MNDESERIEQGSHPEREEGNGARTAATALVAFGTLVLLFAAAVVVFLLIAELTRGQWMLAGSAVVVLAFLLCLLMRSALGSAAVAMVTTSSIVAPLCVQMGESGIVMGLAICAASMAFATPTDAAFWLVQKLNNLSFKDTWITHTFGNAIACVVMFAIVILLNMCRGFLPGL